jgi:leader peptidase (prepilin peptidase)/N-methyltransferase
MALLFIAPVLLFHTWSALALWLVLAVFGLPLIVTDLRLHRLPNSLTFSLLLATLLTVIVSAIRDHDFQRLASSLLGGVGLGAFYLLIALISKGGMGMGDVKLSLSVGSISGYFGLRIVLVSSFTAFALGSVIGLLLIFFGKAGRKSAIPFGPFMILGQFVGLLVAAH